MGLSNSDMGKTLAAFRAGIEDHDERNPSHSAWGIGLSYFDLTRLGFDDGEQLWPGVVVEVDSKCSGNFRILCDGQEHGEKAAEATEARGREALTNASAYAPTHGGYSG